MIWGGMHGGIAVDGQGHVYLSTDGAGSILVFDRDGKLVRSMGREWQPVEAGQGTHDLQLNREGGQDFVYIVSLFRHEFAKLTTTGEVVWVKGYPRESGLYGSKEEFSPTGIAVAPSGDVYVTDGYGANYVHRYDARGEYVSSWGGKCSPACEDGKFSTPHKIAIDLRGPQPTVLVTDRANHRLQWFSLEGRHLKTLDGSGNDLLRLPSTLELPRRHPGDRRPEGARDAPGSRQRAPRSARRQWHRGEAGHEQGPDRRLGGGPVHRRTRRGLGWRRRAVRLGVVARRPRGEAGARA